MSTGTPTPAPAPTSTPKAKKNKKKKKVVDVFEITFSNVCKWFTCLFFLSFFLKGCFCSGGGESRPEQFHRHKMSQVPRVWPAPAWADQQQDVRSTQPNALQRVLQRTQEKLQRGLDSIPQYEGKEWEYKSWHGPIPERREPQPFQLYSPDCERQ